MKIQLNKNRNNYGNRNRNDNNNKNVRKPEFVSSYKKAMMQGEKLLMKEMRLNIKTN